MNETSSGIPPVPPSSTATPYAAPLRPHRGTLVLVLGILGLLCCFPLAIVAWVLGHTDLNAMDRGDIDPSGRSLTQAGKICGIIGTVLGVLGTIWWIAWAGFGILSQM